MFAQNFNADDHPQNATAETPAVFHQDTADSSAVIWETFKGVGSWETKAEEQDVPSDAPIIGNQKTFTVTEFAKSVDIPKTFFDDNKHASYEKMVSSFARRARTTRDKNAFAVFRNAFTTATTSDGVALISSSHLNQNGTTVSNNVATAFGETSLDTAIQTLLEMKAQDDEIDGALAKTLVVPPALYKLAVEVTESELRSGGPDNDLNVYSAKYGINVYTSRFLGSAAGGSQTAWYLLGDTHSIYRFVRQGVQTDLVDYRGQRNNNYIYKGSFREVVGAMSFEGIVGSAT